MSEARAPHVSVVMTVYNGEAYLAEAVASVLGQDFQDFELLVVDDASTDASPRILQDFAGRDPRVRVIRQQRNGGPVSASNAGLVQARGALIARLDADDVASPQRLGRQVETFRARPDLVLLGTAFDYIDGAGRWIAAGEPPVDDATLQPTLLEYNPFCHSSMMMRANALRALGGYRQLVNRYSLDYDLVLRLAEMGTIGNLPDRLVRYRIHPGQITAQKMEAQIRSAHLYRALARQRRRGDAEDVPRALAEIDAAPRVLRDALVGGCLFWAAMMEGFDRAQARGLRWRAMRTAPADPRVWRMLASRVRRSIAWRAGA